MNKETFVAFATQKGGVGKSTVTALVANYIHNVMGIDVAVIDCDEPQHSIAGLRDKETALIEKNDSLKAVAYEHFRKSGRKGFPIIRSNAVQALDDADSLLSEKGYRPEIVFFDLPGTLKSDGVIKTLSQMDYIFTPVSADRFVVESALQFVMMFNDNLVTTGLAKTKDISLFWTMVDGREKTGLYDLYGKLFAENNFRVLDTRLPDSKRFRREPSDDRIHQLRMIHLYHFAADGENLFRAFNGSHHLRNKIFVHPGIIVQQKHIRCFRCPDANVDRS